MNINKLNKQFSLIPVLLVLFILGISGYLIQPAMSEQPVNETLAILSTTDLHQYILPYNYMEDRPQEDIGFSKTYSLIQRAREKYPNTILLDGGDAIQGSLAGVIEAQVEPLKVGEIQTIVEIMNTAGYDAAAIGNHEVQDYGLDFLDRAIEGSDFPWLSANMVHADEPSEFYTQPYVVLEKEIAGKPIKIGVISFVPPQIMQWGRAHLHGRVIAFDILEQAERYIPRLAEKSDILIANAHTGIDDSPPDSYEARENAGYYLAQFDEVDAMITGHQHFNFPNDHFADMAGVDVAAGTVHGVPTVMPGSWGSRLGIIELQLQHDGDGWFVEDHLVELWEVDATVESSPKIEQMAADLHQRTLDYVRTPIGRTAIPIKSYFSRIKDSAVTQLVNDAQLWYGKQQLAGSEYEELPLLSASAPFVAGRQGPDYYSRVSDEITIGDVTDIYLYDNTVFILKLDGRQIIDWIEHSGRNFNTINPDAEMAQHLLNYQVNAFNFDVIEGIEYIYDLTRDVGERVIEATYQGEPLSSDMKFAVVTNDYRAGGGGGFPHMEDDNVIFQSADVNRQQLIYYIEAQEEIDPQPSGNWKIKPLDTRAPLLVRSHSETADFLEARNIQGIEIIEVDEEGWGIYQIDLTELP